MAIPILTDAGSAGDSSNVKSKRKQVSIPIPPEPDANATKADLFKAARRHWAHYGFWPDWYHRRKKELDNG